MIEMPALYLEKELHQRRPAATRPCAFIIICVEASNGCCTVKFDSHPVLAVVVRGQVVG